MKFEIGAWYSYHLKIGHDRYLYVAKCSHNNGDLIKFIDNIMTTMDNVPSFNDLSFIEKYIANRIFFYNINDFIFKKIEEKQVIEMIGNKTWKEYLDYKDMEILEKIL